MAKLIKCEYDHVGNITGVFINVNGQEVVFKPVRHGRWYRDPTNENYFCCSVCDGANGLWHQFADCRYEFCPWCGAKMDGGAEDEHKGT